MLLCFANFCNYVLVLDSVLVQTTLSYESPVEGEFQWVSMLLCVVIRQKYEVEFDWPI